MTIPELSPVELQIVRLVAQGRSRRGIADELGLSLKTVDWYVARGRQKLAQAATLHKRIEAEADQIVEALGPQGGRHCRQPREEVMTHSKAIIGLLLTAVAVGVFAAAQASASGTPIVIPYEKTCNELTGHCQGAANGVTIEMQVDPATFRATGDAFKYTLTESITVGAISFTAVMNAHQSPAGFIVLNGTVTNGSFVGAQVHQRSNLVGVSPDGTTTSWTGELQLMPASG